MYLSSFFYLEDNFTPYRLTLSTQNFVQGEIYLKRPISVDKWHLIMMFYIQFYYSI